MNRQRVSISYKFELLIFELAARSIRNSTLRDSRSRLVQTRQQIKPAVLTRSGRLLRRWRVEFKELTKGVKVRILEPRYGYATGEIVEVYSFPCRWPNMKWVYV